MYQFAHEPGQLRNCPKTPIHVGSPASTRNRAQYHDLSRLEGSFRYTQHGGVAEISPSPLDPYAMVNAYHQYRHERNIWNVYQGCYPQPASMYQQRSTDPVAVGGYRQPPYVKGQVQGYFPQSNKLSDTKIEDIRRTAKNFVENCCPLLGEKPYCLPPIERYRHPDKSNKKLIQGIESERRVFGTFERFFVEQNIPVFMLCNYPLSGFLQVFRTENLDKALMTFNGQHGKNTVMLLLSNTFGVTVLSVSIISGNSQFDHLRHRVLKSLTQMKEISATVSKLLTLLGVKSEVRQAIAFPNLKRSVLERICKDKQLQHSIGSFCTLHADELTAPFEDEWSDPAHKQQFHIWMLQNILSHDSTLSQEDLHLVVGALLSPKLSKVDFVQDEKMIMPIPERIQYADTKESQPADVGQMKLTVDGVTKSFDEFMDQYVTAYYPNVGERTYRVPPIHFNIQSLKKPAEYISAFKGDSVLKRFNGGQVDKKSHVSAQLSEMTCTGKDTSSPFHGETIQFIEAPNHSSVSFGNNSHSGGQGDSSRSAVVRREYSFSNNLQKSGDCTEGERSFEGSDGQDSLSVRSNSENFILSSGIYFKDSPNSSSSLLYTAVSASDTSHQNIATSTSMRRELPNLSLLVAQTPANALLQAVQNVEVLSKVMDKDIRKDEGENRVISALEMLGRRSNFGGQEEDPMFIICGYQYNNYLNKLREEMFSKEDMNRPVRAFGQTMRAEHDCLIFHKTYGAIIVCIKAIGDNFEEWHATEDQKIACTKNILEKALKQLNREEAMIRHVTSDLHIKFTCHKLIALPNMSRESVKAALWTDLPLKKRIRDTLGHEADLFLCSDELPPKHTALWDCSDEVPPGNPALGNSTKAEVKERLLSWWKNVKIFLEENNGSRIELTEYKQLIGRYCGLFSTVEVWSPTNPRIEVRSASEAVKTCAGRFCKFVLLPCQLKALCSDARHMFLYGPPGSGKTLVLMLKAKQWLLAGKTVVLINSRPGSRHGFPYAYGISTRLIHMMLESKVPMHRLNLINIDSLNFKERDLDSIASSCCVIMDEVTPSSHTIIDSLCCRQVSSIWCAGIFHEDRPNTTQAFVTHRMDKIIRCPPAVQSVLRHTEAAVRLQKPYEEVYQRSITEPEHSTGLNNAKFNKYTDTIQKSRVAYYSKLQKGQIKYNKSETSMYSLLSHFRQLEMLVSYNPSQKYIKNSFRAYTSERGHIVDNIWTKHSSFCNKTQKEYRLTKKDRQKMGLLCTTEARQVYKRMFLLAVIKKDRIGKTKTGNFSCSDNKLVKSYGLSKEMLLKENRSHDDIHGLQLDKWFSDHFIKTHHHCETSEACSQCLDETIELINAYFRRKFNKELQIVQASSGISQGANSDKPNSASGSTLLATNGLNEVSSDSSQQQQPTQHFTELDSARISSKMSDNCKVTTLETEKVKYDPKSLNNRLIQKYSRRCELTSTTAPGSESVPQDLVLQEVRPMFSEDLNHDQESLEKRLAEKYGIRRQVKSEISSSSNNAEFLNTVVSDSEAPNKTLAEKYSGQFTETSLDLCQQGAMENKRLWQKYNQECSRTFVASTGGETVSQDLAYHKFPSKSDDLKNVQDTLEKRLAEKYGSGHHATSTRSSLGYNTSSQFTSLSDSEALNTRLMEKYSGRFIKRPVDPRQQKEKLKSSSYNTNTNVHGSGSQPNKLPLGGLTVKNKYNVSKNSYSEKGNSYFLNARIQKYGRINVQTSKQLTTGQFCDGSSHTEMSLPSDGPQPTIIDHGLHSKTGSPTKCQDCARELFQFLNSMIRPDEKTTFSKRKHNFYDTKLTTRGSSERGPFLLSSISPKGSFFHKPEVFENRALAWSDVLIVVEEMAEDSVFVKVLKSKNVPVEVCLGESACRIEDPREKKLFITSNKETTGIERAIIVFIPSEKQVSSQQSPGRVGSIDLKLASCISQFSEKDKAALWYVASRSLASLVLVLP